MPFDEEDDVPSKQSSKIGLKKVSDQKSIFDNKFKKTSSGEYARAVRDLSEKNVSYKERAASLVVQFNKIMEDKTLPENKDLFSHQLESEVLTKMIEFAVEINNDPNEPEGMGSLSWITLLFKTSLNQKDRLNILEYKQSLINEKVIRAIIKREVGNALEEQKDKE